VVGVAHVEAREPRGELPAVHLRPAYPEGLHAGGLDDPVHVLAGLLADHLAEHPAEQPDVVAQRRLLGTAVDAAAAVGAEVGDVHCGFGHRVSIDAACVRRVSWQGSDPCPPPCSACPPPPRPSPASTPRAPPGTPTGRSCCGSTSRRAWSTGAPSGRTAG